MANPQQNQKLPSPKILLPIGLMFIAGSILAFVILDVHLVSGLMAGLMGLAGLAMTVQSVQRLIKGER